MTQLSRITRTLPGDDVRYCVDGPDMALDFHVIDIRHLVPGAHRTAGLEVHYKRRPSYMRERGPNFEKCWLTGCQCWCDGTSLYATEWLLPMFDALGVDDFWTVLEREWRKRHVETFGEGRSDDAA